MLELYKLLNTLLDVYMLILLVYCIFSFLLSLGIVDPYSKTIRVIYTFLSKACDPILDAIRRVIPSLGTIDISPVIVMLAINYLLRPALYHVFLYLVQVG